MNKLATLLIAYASAATMIKREEATKPAAELDLELPKFEDTKVIEESPAQYA